MLLFKGGVLIYAEHCKYINAFCFSVFFLLFLAYLSHLNSDHQKKLYYTKIM